MAVINTNILTQPIRTLTLTYTKTHLATVGPTQKFSKVFFPHPPHLIPQQFNYYTINYHRILTDQDTEPEE